MYDIPVVIISRELKRISRVFNFIVCKMIIYNIQVALLLVSEARYAHFVIAHLMIILWRSTCTHTCMMAKLVMKSVTHCNGNSGAHVEDGATGLCWM